MALTFFYFYILFTIVVTLVTLLNTSVSLFFSFFLCYIDTKRYKPNLNTVHATNLNFVLQFEIFVHYDSQLRVSHLILECTPLYTSYQDLEQELTVGSPLLSHLDVRLRSFLCKGLTLEKARRLGPYQIREGSLPPVKDGSIDRVFHSQVEHILVEEPVASGQVEGPVVAELVNSSSKGIEPEDLASEMVVKRKMTVDRFLPGGQLTFKQHAPSPPTPHRGKRPQDTFESTECPSDVPSGTLPTSTTTPLVI